ncbi:unnamed protein product, partial [Lampetra planeri]
MAPWCSGSFTRGCRRLFYWIPVLFIALIVFWSYYAFVLQLCIESIDDTGEKGDLYLLVYHVIFIMFLWAYWQTIFTGPMTPLKEFHLSHSDKEQLERQDRGESRQEILRRIAKDLPIYTRTNSGAVRFCERCQLLKPDRCHHCSVCDKCILKMDHHCPWYEETDYGAPGTKTLCRFNRVQTEHSVKGFFFSLLLLSLSVTEAVAVRKKRGQNEQLFCALNCCCCCCCCFPQNGLPDTQAKFHILFLFFSASMFSVSLASLFIYHCWLVCKNRSTLEAVRAPVFRHGTDKSGFSLGVSKNFRQVFGDEVKYWPLPIFS